MKKTNKLWFGLSCFLVLAMAFSLAGIVLPSNPAKAQATTIEIGSTTVAVGSSGSVDIFVMNYPLVPEEAEFGLGAYDITVGFEPAELTINSVTGGNSPFTGPITFIGLDYVNIAQFHATTVQPDGNIKLCTLNFTCNAQSVSTLALTVNDLVDTDGEPVAHTPVNGTITQILAAIEVTPTTGPRGTEISVSGIGFGALETGIAVTFAGTPVLADIVALGDGTWGPETFNIPATAALGTNTIDAYGSVTDAGTVPDVDFTVPTPAIAIDPVQGPSGTEVSVTGTNFAVDETGIAVTWDGTDIITDITAGADGSWGPESFTVPGDALAGVYTVDAYGAVTPATEVADANFTVIPVVAIDNATLTVGGSGSADIWVLNYPVVPDAAEFALGSYDITVGFDPTQISIDSVTGGDNPFNGPIFNIEADYINITQFQAASLYEPYGDVKICTLNFTCLAEGTSTLTLTVNTLADTDGEPVASALRNGTVTQITYIAEAAIAEEIDASKYVSIPVSIVRVMDTVTFETIPGIQVSDYIVDLSFTEGFMEIVDIAGGDAPFDAAPTWEVIGPGLVSVTQDLGATGVEPSVVIFRIKARLTGSVLVSDNLQVSVVEVSTPGGATMTAYDQPMALSFQRGDARIPQDGLIRITDAMYGAQYVVGFRPATDIMPLNLASVKNDTGSDKINITDCLYLAQYVVGMRDENLNLK